MWLQGVHALVDAFDGFGGVASRVVQDLADECGGKAMVALPVSPPCFQTSVSVCVCDRQTQTDKQTDKQTDLRLLFRAGRR